MLSRFFLARLLIKNKADVEDAAWKVMIKMLSGKGLKRIVISEVDDMFSDESAERLLKAAKITIATTAVTTTALGAAAGSTITGTGAAINETFRNITVGVIGAALLGGAAVATITLLPEAEIEPPMSIEQDVPLYSTNHESKNIIEPSVTVTYSIITEAANTDINALGSDNTNNDVATPETNSGQDYDNPINPLTCEIVSSAGETLKFWVLTNSQSTEITTGINTTIDITELNLENGQYLITWNMLDAQNNEFFAYWQFIIEKPL